MAQPNPSQEPEVGSVLVFDDEPTHTGLFSTLCTQAGLYVEGFTDAEKVIPAMRQAKGSGFPFDLALVDAMFLLKSYNHVKYKAEGFQLADMIREESPSTKVIMLSAATDFQASSYKDALLKGVICDYMVKPIKDIAAFRNRVKSAVEGSGIWSADTTIKSLDDLNAPQKVEMPTSPFDMNKVTSGGLMYLSMCGFVFPYQVTTKDHENFKVWLGQDGAMVEGELLSQAPVQIMPWAVERFKDCCTFGGKKNLTFNHPKLTEPYKLQEGGRYHIASGPMQ